jgi:serine/threonine protein kinase
MAPEALRGKVDAISSTLVDVYSFGIIMYEVFFERVPYQNNYYTSIIDLGTDVVGGKRPDIPKYIDEMTNEEEKHYLDLMVRCWNGTIQHRPTFDTIFSEMMAL